MSEFFHILMANWWGILLIALSCVLIWFVLSVAFYKVFFKRLYDIVLSSIALVVLSPALIILTIAGTFLMRGNPFFVQKRPGKNEKIFSLIKFRTMTNRKDENGVLLPDEKRLTLYGKVLRTTSLDELPELYNIFLGQMSIVGPRPLLVQYLTLYNKEQQKRHKVRPGLTGLAQVSGRNAISWKQKFDKDLEYVQHISFLKDVKIILKTVLKIFKREGISQEGNMTMAEFTGKEENFNG